MRAHPLAVVLVSLFASHLAAQATNWTSFQDRRGHAMASTPTGGVLVFGGEHVSRPGSSLSDTLRLAPSNSAWNRQPNAPVARQDHAMVGLTLPNGQTKFVVFGGRSGSGNSAPPTADTWTNDGTTWDPRGQGSQRPAARHSHAMVAGQLSGAFAGVPRVWMFGGFSGTAEFSDLWSYQVDVDQWNLLGPQAGQPAGTWPPARSSHAMAFYPGSGGNSERVYLFGGRTSGVAFANDLWRYDPYAGTWQQMTPPTAPSGRRDTAMAYLPGQGGIVMFGGLTTLGVVGDTWIYDPTNGPNGNRWTQVAPASSPSARSGHAVSVDVSGDNLILTGGTDAVGEPALGSWVWSSLPPANWSEQYPVPSPRYGVAMAFDRNASRTRHVMFGGVSAASGLVLDETWELDGIDWVRRTPAARPSARTDVGLVYDTTRDRVVLYGGRNQVGAGLGDTWEWNGNSWTIPNVTGTPPAKGGIQPVYDSRRGRIVMPVAGASAMETWQLAGNAWTQIPVAVPPSIRTNYGAAYDARRDEVVMFGGMTGPGRTTESYFSETWVFDGTTWIRRFPATRPSPRGWCKLAYDESRSRVVLYGGANATVAFEETWEWDGTNWVDANPVAIPPNPNSAFAHAISYDAERSLTVTHGRLGTWDYGPLAPAETVSYGTGCATSAGGTLSIQQLGWSRLWIGDRLELEFQNVPAASLGLMLWGMSDSSFGGGVPLPLDLRLINFSTGACYLRTSADIASEAVFPGTVRYQSLALPFDPFLLGVRLFLQAAWFDSGQGPSNNAVTSNALSMTLGQKAAPAAPVFEPNPTLSMQRIEAGTFQMGSVAVGGTAVPVHPVTISQDFWVGKYEVTQAQYQAVMGNNPSFHQGAGYPNAAQRPVEQVNWLDAMQFCATLDAQERAAGRVPAGYQYRLPTEAEWEFFCRSGTTTEWSAGASLGATQANLNYSLSQTSVVGAYAANPWGLYDVHGNVWEWCLDCADSTANYPSTGVADPYVALGGYRVRRGGSWTAPADLCRSANRWFLQRIDALNGTGLRIVLAPTKVFYPRPDLGMVPIQAGTFQMGSPVTPLNVPPYYNQADAQPVHAVTITRPFWVGKHEVTQAQYQAVMGSNPSQFQGSSYPNASQRPVEQVSWFDAMSYCAALTATEAAAGRIPAGYQYRLPTEAEWEYVCRAGTTTEWNTGASLTTGQANFNNTLVQTTVVVGSYLANSWGLFDTCGNVFEHCLDSWDRSANYPSSAVSDPYVSSGPVRVFRGGGWGSSAVGCRSARRGNNVPDGSDNSIGFRVVLAPVLVP